MSGGATGAVDQQNSMPVYGANTPVRTTGDANRYTSTYTPTQQTPQQSVQNMGLEALYQSMASQYAPISQQFNSMDQFYQQAPQQMPTYQSRALNYRPDMTGAMQKLSQVTPSVAEMNRRQAIEDARIAAEQAAFDAANPQPTYDYGGGG